jgi:hypothetical protein
MAATPSMLRPMVLALLPPRRSPDRPIAPVVSTVPPWGSGGAKCARPALASPPDATAKRGYRLSVPVVNILQHMSNWLAGRVNFFGFRRAAGGGLVRPFSFGARHQSPSSPRIATALDLVPKGWRRRLLRGAGPRPSLPSLAGSRGVHPQRARNKNRTLFIASATKVPQRQQTEPSPRLLTASVSPRGGGPLRRPGHGRGCAGTGSGRRDPSAPSGGLACPRCERDGRPSGSTCTRRARRRRGST